MSNQTQTQTEYCEETGETFCGKFAHIKPTELACCEDNLGFTHSWCEGCSGGCCESCCGAGEEAEIDYFPDKDISANFKKMIEEIKFLGERWRWIDSWGDSNMPTGFKQRF